MWLWGYFPGNLNTVHPYIMSRALVYGFQTFLYAYLGFFLADGVARFWWHRWTPTMTSTIHERKVTMSVSDGHVTDGVLYLPDRGASGGQASKHSLVIVSHGLNDNLFRAKPFAQALSAAGYAVLTWNYRKKGRARGKITDFKAHVADLREILDSWNPPECIDRARVHLCGWSLGGMVSLIAGFPHPNVVKIFAWSTWANLTEGVLQPLYKNPFAVLRYFFKGQLVFPDDDTNDSISPAIYFSRMKQIMGEARFKEDARRKVFLCHAKDDDTVRFPNFEANMAALELPPENTHVFSKGSHLMARKETVLLGLASKFFSSSLQEDGRGRE